MKPTAPIFIAYMVVWFWVGFWFYSSPRPVPGWKLLVVYIVIFGPLILQLGACLVGWDN